jgi:XTP/dITP diphosphohydrolase
MDLVFATHNPHKFREIKAMAPDHIRLLSLRDIGCDSEIPETAATLEGNAIAKALHIKNTYGYPAFSDDSGLLTEALNGGPGVHSARFAGPGKDAAANMDKLLKMLKNKDNRTAQFKTVIALIIKEEPILFEGVADGEITLEKRGNEGFGYDAVFQPRGYARTFAELPFAIKNTISHRGKAMKQLLRYLAHALR